MDRSMPHLPLQYLRPKMVSAENRISALLKTLFIMTFLFVPTTVFASSAATTANIIDMTSTAYGYLGIIIFVLAYSLVPFEDKLHLRKSKPVLLAAGLIWILIAIAYAQSGDTHTAEIAVRHNLLEYAELFLFLLVAMTYINAMEERNTFLALRAFLVSRGFSLRKLFWVTGTLAFCISPIADNLTTALLMGAVVMAVGGDNKKFVALACINVVVAANAGGAFSPFGDITTLMVWQKGKVAFSEFFHILVPSLVNWLVPAIIMNFKIDKTVPEKLDEQVKLKYGAKAIIIMFLVTIATAVSFHNFLHLPPVVGMMLGLGLLGPLSYHIKRHEGRSERYDYVLGLRDAESNSELASIVKSKLNLETKLEKTHLPVFVIDSEHRITHWNEACAEVTGVKADEAIGTTESWKPFYNDEQPVLADLVISSGSESKIAEQYQGNFKRNEILPGSYEATRFNPKIGEEGRWVHFSAAPIYDQDGQVQGAVQILEDHQSRQTAAQHFDLMKNISRAEWDTLLFFYGVILCVGGLTQFGYLGMLSEAMYQGLGATMANSIVGVLSAIIDNIPVMFAVLTMNPEMSHGQWLLVTLTAGVGGSMLSIGSAAGVALMGTARGIYTFGSHLKWTPVIMLGYIASILCHLWINASFM